MNKGWLRKAPPDPAYGDGNRAFAARRSFRVDDQILIVNQYIIELVKNTILFALAWKDAARQSVDLSTR